MKDDKSKSLHAHIVDEKGRGDGWIVAKIVDDIDALGYTSIIIKGDGEPALVQVMKEVKKARKHDTIIENPPAYDPQSNGVVETAVDTFMGQLRTIKI